MIGTASASWVCTDRNSRLDWAVEGLLIALLGFMPLAIRAVQPWSEQVVGFGGGPVVAFGVRMVLFGPEPGSAWNWAYLPLSCSCWSLRVQLATLQTHWVSAVSQPTPTRRSKTELSAELQIPQAF